MVHYIHCEFTAISLRPGTKNICHQVKKFSSDKILEMAKNRQGGSCGTASEVGGSSFLIHQWRACDFFGEVAKPENIPQKSDKH